MTITHHDLLQGTPEWYQVRNGLITASEMKLLLSPSLKTLNNEKTRAHLYELCAQRVNGYTEPTFVGYEMERGKREEVLARNIYNEFIAPVKEVGFITNDKWGFTLGYSPDGLVGDDGLIEVKSRRQRFQFETALKADMPEEFMMQCQTGMMVAEKQWIDFISHCGGMHMVVVRVYPDQKIQDAIVEVCGDAEMTMHRMIDVYCEQVGRHPLWMPTERIIDEVMEVSNDE